jgi:hypothetical protein
MNGGGNDGTAKGGGKDGTGEGGGDLRNSRVLVKGLDGVG